MSNGQMVGSIMARSSEVAPRRPRANCRGPTGASFCPPLLLEIRSRPNRAKLSFAWHGPQFASPRATEFPRAHALMCCHGRAPQGLAVKSRAKGWRAS